MLRFNWILISLLSGLIFLPLARAEIDSQAKQDHASKASDKEQVLEVLFSERDSSEAFAKAVEQAKHAGLNDQAILEARFLYFIDLQDDVAVAGLLPEFLQMSDQFLLENSEIFAFKDDWLAVIEYIRAIAKLQAGDKPGFKRHITEAFWLSPRQASAFGVHIQRMRLAEVIESVVIDFNRRFAPLDSGEAIPLKQLQEGRRALLIYFWSPASRQSEALLPDFLTMAATLESSNIGVIALLANPSDSLIVSAREMLGSISLKKPGSWLLDSKSDSFANILRLDSFPYACLISQQGNILFAGDLSESALWDELRKIAPEIQRPQLDHEPPMDAE
ncbi:MAG: hypothetical protein EAZ42_07390 [Verrucomicrobia bacterium]|nr:MAG: hypothetical protein EAZ42_07390 [Verrucomicrobiota bacterium]